MFTNIITSTYTSLLCEQMYLYVYLTCPRMYMCVQVLNYNYMYNIASIQTTHDFAIGAMLYK